MLPKVSLLDELRKGGFEASLITTFNAYLPFYEDVVLRRLVNAGVRHNMLLMDARQFSVSLEQRPPRCAGRSYTLAPIGVPGVFHPKLIFLVGEKKGLIIVGSHNMTLAGFGFNRELTNVIRITSVGDETGVVLADQVWSEINRWIDTSSKDIPSKVRESIFKFREFAPWLGANKSETDSEVQLLTGRADGPTLWEQLCDLATNPVKEIFLTGAFFDKNLDFLNRIQTDLQPDQIVVAIDPNTVEISTDSQIPSRVRFVQAANFGTDLHNDDAAGYLHAKGMFLRQQNNDCLFVSGSANPSRPAWLASNSDGNTELMVARLGAEAESAAHDLGFIEIPNLPELNDNDWQTIANSPSRSRSAVSSNCTFGIAIVKDDEIYIDSDLANDLQSCKTVLLDVDYQEIVQCNSLVRKEQHYVATFNRKELSQACFVRCLHGTQTVANLLLHHSQIVEEQARTGVQRAFRNALLSLQTESPDIEEFFKCLDEIELSVGTNTLPASSLDAPVEKATVDQDDPTFDSLAVDLADTSSQKPRHRLTQSSDSGFVLDSLIFRRRFQVDRTMEAVDHRGRTEEEQIGEDDAEDTNESFLTENTRYELLMLCHKNVSKKVTHMTRLLKDYSKLSTQSEKVEELPVLLLRLLVIVAVLRELRFCDGRVQWVDQGYTTVPVKQRKGLFNEVMFSLFEDDPSILNMEMLGDKFVASEDLAKLKGLLLWLAWDCGFHFDQNKPFMETHEMEIKRHQINAMLLALAQTVQQDKQVSEEARQSIGNVSTSSNLDWLDGIQSLAIECDAIKNGKSTMHSAEAVKPGDVVIRRNNRSGNLRIVESVPDGGLVYMFKLSRTKDRDYLHGRNLLTTKIYLNQSKASHQ